MLIPKSDYILNAKVFYFLVRNTYILAFIISRYVVLKQRFFYYLFVYFSTLYKNQQNTAFC